MRIDLLTYSTRPRGGVVHTLALAEALAGLQQEVHVWTLARGGDDGFFRPVDPGVAVHAVPFAALDGEPVGARIVRSIDVLAAGLDGVGRPGGVVHAQDCISANAALRRGRDVVRTIHHLDRFTTPELAACHERAVVAPSARVCVSRAVADEVQHGWGLSPTVIPNGVDAARFAAGAEDAVGRERWRSRLGRFVLALGGIEPRKGSLDLLRAMAEVQREDPGLRLVVAGGETLFDYRDYRAEFDRLAAELGVDLEVLGPVHDPDLPSLVAEAAALGFCSVQEGFGLAAMEALAAGVPVVARDLPVLREVLGDAVLFADDVAGIAAALRVAVAGGAPAPTAGRALAASYTWDAAARAHLEFYASLPSTP